MSRTSKTRNQRKQAQQRKRQEKARRKRKKERQKSTQSTSAAIELRLRKRLACQIPRAWEGEEAVDRALFDRQAESSLEQGLREQVGAIRDALTVVCGDNGAGASDAERRVACIPRSSPLSPWRLFIRGLQSWLTDDFDSARSVWSRLDPNRRPARIAAVLQCVGNDDIVGTRDRLTPRPADLDSGNGDPGDLDSGNGGTETKASEPCSADVAPPNDAGVASPRLDTPHLDATQLYAAKLVHRLRFDRAAIRCARLITSQTEDLHGYDDLSLGSDKLASLKEFFVTYCSSEPRLVEAMQHATLLRVFTQPYTNLFELAKRDCRGPRYDRRNLLLSAQYYSQFKDSKARVAGALEQYVGSYLPANDEISRKLRSAMASQLFLLEARDMMDADMATPFLAFNHMFGIRVDKRRLNHCLIRAINEYPENGEAHAAYAEWIESRMRTVSHREPEHKLLEEELAGVMSGWAKALPDDVEPRLWLVDFLMENDRLKEAAPHVEWVRSSRHEDPRVRAMPWKLHILEAMQLCRKKSQAHQACDSLDKAESAWPEWLPNDWLPYLRAAVALRCDRSAYEQLRSELISKRCERDALSDACMMLGAAQRMHVPSGGLKPLRPPIDEAVNRLRSHTSDQLASAAAFFWDLQRMGLSYPAQRRHAKKFGVELWSRLRRRPTELKEKLRERDYQAALLWMSDAHFFVDNYSKVPAALAGKCGDNKFVAAAILNSIFGIRYYGSIAKHDESREVLQQAVFTESDPYYRYWFGALISKYEQERPSLAAYDGRPAAFGGWSSPFSRFLDESDLFMIDHDDVSEFNSDGDGRECYEANEPRRAACQESATTGSREGR